MRIGFSASRACNMLARGVRRAAGRRDDEGTTLVEFALTLPLFIGVLTATATFSMGLYTMQQIGNATANAVGVAGAVGGIPSGTTIPGTTPGDPCATAVQQITAALPHLTAANFTYSMSITTPTTGGETTTNYPSTGMSGSSFSCPSPPMQANYPITLTVNYAYSWFPMLNWNSKYTVLNVKPASNLSSTQAAIQE
jgi:Flp pilus assembly protein TadG